MNLLTKTLLSAPTDSRITPLPDLQYTNRGSPFPLAELWPHPRSLLDLNLKTTSPLGPPDHTQGGYADVQTLAPPRPPLNSGPLLHTNLGSVAYLVSAAQTEKLQR